MMTAELRDHLSPVLAERGWRLRLHADAAPQEVIAAARRALRAGLAAPGDEAVGFALLHPVEGGWAFLVHVWRGTNLVREASLLLSAGGGPPRHCPALARCLGVTEDVQLLAREAAAWGRHRGDAGAYFAESVR